MFCFQRASAEIPVAAFNADHIAGCSPLIVQFSDNSTGNPTNWFWDRGNGSSSSVNNPIATYIDPGVYTITLTVSNSSGFASVSLAITVHPKPVVQFSAADTAGCTPLSVSFTDQSSTSLGSLTSWEWNFGDGSVSNAQHPVYTYTMAGTFNVVLKATNSFGCSETGFHQQYIKAGSGAKADFIVNVPTYCQAPVPINFTNNSQAQPGSTYSWDFGDGTTSSLQDPVHNYDTGNFVITLTVKSADGCNSTKQQSIQLSGKNVAFTGPSSICVGTTATFIMTSTPKPLSQTWSMGDGGSYSTDTIKHTYHTPGNYAVSLSNEFAGGCVSSTTTTITVVPGPAIGFIADSVAGCKAPHTVKFESTGAASGFVWDFGDGSFSAMPNPVHTYVSTGSFNVTLVAVNTSGCTASIQKQAFVQIQKPSVAISNLPLTNGCTPYYFVPQASVSAIDGIASYFWDFGNGVTSTAPAPACNYANPGLYTVKLSIQTNGGCIDSAVYENAVSISPGPPLDFSVNPLIACIDQPVLFSTSAAGAASLTWFFGDGDTANAPIASHRYQEVKEYTISLLVRYPGCVSRLTRTNYISVLPPKAKFTATRDCNDKRMIHFTNQSDGAVSTYWSFGDGNTSSDPNPVYTYSSDGSYKVTLTVSNGSCIHTRSDTVTVSTATIDFYATATTICKGETFTLKTIIPETVNVTQFQWTVPNSGAATVSSDTINWALYNADTFDVSLTIVSDNGCTETISKSGYITVFGPTSDFVADKSGGCENVSVQFMEGSTSDGTHPVTQWYWDFGDAATGTGTAVTHTYGSSGKYQVILKVTDSYGCSDTRSKANFISVSNGKARFRSADTFGCIGSNIIFSDTSAGTISSWQWDFGDGLGMTGVQHPSHQYSDSGYYTVKLKIVETSGCTDSISKTSYITIKNPDARFGLSDTFSSCPPLTVHFSDSSYYVQKWTWDFGDGGSSPVQHPVNLYHLPALYKVKLTVTSPGGCIDTATAAIRILGPSGEFKYTPLQGCTPLPVAYTVSSTEAVKFLWDFSDGIIDSGSVASATHVYLSGGRFIPKVILTDAVGCAVPVIGKDTVYIQKTRLAFNGSPLELCDSGTVQFQNESIENAAGVQYQWLCNGNSIDGKNPAIKFIQPGTYTVTLTSNTPMGCRDTLTRASYIRVHKSPVATLLSEDSLCAPALFHSSVNLDPDTSSIASWYWVFANGSTSVLELPPPQNFSSAGSFQNSVLIIDNEGCSTVAVKNVVVNPIPPLQVSVGATICRGESIQLNATGAVKYEWFGNVSALSCDFCPTPVATPLHDAVFVVKGSSEFGCEALDSVAIKVYQPHRVSVEKSVDSICPGKTALLKAFGAPMYQWIPAEGLSLSTVANPFAAPAVSTLYKVVGLDSLGCFTDTATIWLKVLSNPTVDAGPDLVLSAGATAQLTPLASADVITSRWSPSTGLGCSNCLATLLTATDDIKYTLKVTNQSGCSAQDQLTITVSCDGSNIFIPNTFSPNGDAVNDVFYVRGQGLFNIRSLRVFNRWGVEVFERTNIAANEISAGWNGKHNGVDVQPDTYIYQVEVQCSNSNVMKYNGTITLIR
ncbi:MAG TPA: PKD domain-containing protein [Chitinophagaceae bacterium]